MEDLYTHLKTDTKHFLSAFWTPLNYKVLKSLKYTFYLFGILPQRQEKDCTEPSTNVQSRNFQRCEQSHAKEPKYISSAQYQQMGLVVACWPGFSGLSEGLLEPLLAYVGELSIL